MQKIAALGFMVVLFAVAPATAFVSESLSITVYENGDSHIRFTYRLSWLERLAVFLKIVAPADEFKKALKRYSGREITVDAVTGNVAAFIVPGFSRRKQADDAVIYRTPAVNFAFAQKLLQNYWFAPLVQVDLSPAMTTVCFPDGYVEFIPDEVSIPAISHTVVK